MAWKHLGEVFDIHGGGIDLVFPHHENEIAQSRSAFHTPVMANYWMHNGFLQVEGEKMAKSLGNFVTIRELLEEWPGEVLRFNMLRSHYRQPIDWTSRGLEESFDTFFELLEVAEDYMPEKPDEEFIESLLDDLNTPRAIARLHELRIAALRGHIDSGAALRSSLMMVGFAAEARETGWIMPKLSRGASKDEIVVAFMMLFPKNYPIGRALRVLQKPLSDLENEATEVCNMLKFADPKVRTGDVLRMGGHITTVNEKISQRLAARKAKDFKESDRIRGELAAMGVVLKDSKEGTKWEMVR
jgi:cysteinyl-tRNA synthetase